MSLLITRVDENSVQMLADTRVTSQTGGSQTLYDGKIIKVPVEIGREVIVGTVGNADHHSLLRYALKHRPIRGDSWQDIFDFFALLYEEADNRGMRVFGASTNFESTFHIAFPNKAWVVNGLAIEPVIGVYASGSGADIALGAMVAKATPMEAAMIACNHNVFCAFPIDVWTANEDGATFKYDRFDERGKRVSKTEPLF